MKKKNKRKTGKKALKKRKIKAKYKRNNHNKSMDLGKVIGFKFKTLNKAYENFVTRRKKEKEKQVKIKSKNREKQIK